MVGSNAKAKNKVDDPCERCREHHLKCDESHPCKKCDRLGQKCVREKGAKFRVGSSAKYDKTFKKDQTWLGQTKKADIQFVDQTTEVERYYAQEDVEEASEAPITALEEPPSSRKIELPPPQRPNTSEPATYQVIEASPALKNNRSESQPSPKRRKVSDIQYDTTFIADDTSRTGTPLSPGLFSPASTNQSQYSRLPDTAAAIVPSHESGMLTPRVWKEQFWWPNAYTTTQCLCLMRYFIQNLAPWFDVCDPERHFTLMVPQRARRCPPLLNAVFTAAARHLARTSRYKTADGTIKFEGTRLPHLTAKSPIEYHNACIAYLIELAKNTNEVGNEDLLAAAIVLRFYEELDTNVTDDNANIFLQTFQLFISAQLSSNLNDFSPFRNACFRTALRQEVTSAFMKQRAVRLPLDTWDHLRSWEPTDDAVWTDRLVLFCADVLQFCFGEDISLSSSNRPQTERWKQLKEWENMWEIYKPISFAPLREQDGDSPSQGLFPLIWLFSESQVSAMQYLYLSRILLTVYDPSVQRLGPGAREASRRISATVREIVLRICGVAVSNSSTQPALVMAHMSIAVCGEYFTNRDEQKSMIELLEALEADHTWPTAKTVVDLKVAWGWNLNG